ncbi:GNAT family N-acetyltransferase [Candidatus Poribacteria bacterium]
MYELPKDEYGKVLPIFADADHNIATVFGAIEGNIPVKIFVDQRKKPTVAIIQTGWLFLKGNEENADFNNELKNMLVDEIMPNLDDGNLLVFSYSDGWRDILDELLTDHGVSRVDRTVLDLDPELFRERHSGWRDRIPVGYRTEQMDRELAGKIPGLIDMWGGADNFLSKGTGGCVMKGDELISSCYAVHVGNGRAETGIQTNEKYRRQGFGTLAGCAYIDHCLEIGLVLEWGCFYNVASGGVAEKLGFANRRNIPVNYVKVEK